MLPILLCSADSDVGIDTIIYKVPLTYSPGPRAVIHLAWNNF